MKITELLTRDEIKSMTAPSDFRGALAVLTTWSIISGALAWVAAQPSALSIGVALVLVGGRQLALAILMHDTAHYSLFKTRALNDLIGTWLCGYPSWQDLKRYREHHLRHHQFAGSEKDPDLDLVEGYPVSRASLYRKLIRDLAGLTGLKRVYGLLAMDLGFIRYTVSSKVVPIDQTHRRAADVLKMALKNLHGVFLTNLALFLILAAFGHPWVYMIWVGAYLTTFSVFLRIRSIAEHACTRSGLDPFLNTRSTLANPLARLTVAPHHVNFHLEHHLLMTVPYFRLPHLHRSLRQKGALEAAYVSRGYSEVLRIASTQT